MKALAAVRRYEEIARGRSKYQRLALDVERVAKAKIVGLNWEPVVCQNSADRKPKWVRRLPSQPEPCGSVEDSSLAHAQWRMGWLSRLCLESGLARWDFPARGSEFPVPDHRELVATAAERHRNLRAGSTRRVQFRRISLYFPCRSGKRQQRRVRSRLAPPPSSPLLQRLPARTPAQPEKSPRFRGVLAPRPRISEPETAGSGPGRRRGPCLSLLRRWAARFRH